MNDCEMQNKFIDLNLTFVEIPKSHGFNDDDYEFSYFGYGSLETKKWMIYFLSNGLFWNHGILI